MNFGGVEFVFAVDASAVKCHGCRARGAVEKWSPKMGGPKQGNVPLLALEKVVALAGGGVVERCRRMVGKIR